MGKKEYKYVRKGFRFDGVHYVVTGKTEEEAIAKKLEKLRELEAGRIDSNATVKVWGASWYDAYVSHRKITAKTKATYKRYLDIICAEIGAQKLKKITPLRLQQLLNERAGNSKSDLDKLRMAIKGLFAQAARSRIIPFDPSEGLELPEYSEGGHRSLTEPERAALRKVAAMPTYNGKPNRAGAWIMTLLLCGLRPGESAALKKTDVDLAARRLTVREAKESGSSRIKSTKTAAGKRTVFIPEELVPWLERQLADNPSPWLFTCKDKKTPLSETAMRRRWETIKKYMDLELGAEYLLVKMPGARRKTLVITRHALAEDLDLYDLRHTYCTDLEAAGVPINVAKNLMGHKDIATTANIYTHAADAPIEAARQAYNAARPSALVKPPVKTQNDGT